MKLQGKVLQSFNDADNNLKKYNAGKDVFQAEEKRYNKLYIKGYVEKGKKICKKQNVDSITSEEK